MASATCRGQYRADRRWRDVANGIWTIREYRADRRWRDVANGIWTIREVSEQKNPLQLSGSPIRRRRQYPSDQEQRGEITLPPSNKSNLKHI